MKRYMRFLLVAMLALFTMGMSDLGGKPSGGIPMPEKDFKATIIDINNIKTICNFVSIDGKDFLKGKHGAASVTVPFEKIASITIKPSGDEKDVKAVINLVDEKEIKVDVDSNSDVYGKTDFGTVQIKMRDLSKIEFSPEK